MKGKGVFILSILLVFFTLFLMARVEAFELITAQEAFDMVINNEATLVDVRTLEEYVFVGSPALEGDGDPIAYLIPWEFLKGTDDNGNLIYKQNADFEALFEQTFGDDKDQALIIICRSGNRSSYAALRLEENGFTNVYEVDNKLKEMVSFPGGRGGVQGSGYKGLYDGYRGYPDRLPEACLDCEHKVETMTDHLDDEYDSVAWMDIGLPITQKIDPAKIPKLKKEADLSTKSTTTSRSQTAIPYMAYQAFPGYMPTYGPTYQFASYHMASAGNGFTAGGFFPSLPQNLYNINQAFFPPMFLPGFALSTSSASSSRPAPLPDIHECGG